MEVVYISRDIKTKEITNIVKVKLDKTQEELDIIFKEYNEKATHYINEQIKDESTYEIAKFAVKWKSQKTLEDIYRSLDEIYDLVDDVKVDIQDFIDEQKDK